MRARTIKHLILWTPTVVTAVWEYARHTFLLPYLSMNSGNIISPVLVFLVTITLLYRLFEMLENAQEQLHREQAVKAAFHERDQLARELHDGISQSLFLLSVKLDRLERAGTGGDLKEATEEIRRTVRHVYDDVRESIANLQSAPEAEDVPWLQSLKQAAAELEKSGTKVTLDWRLADTMLTSREKVELLAIIREALMNIRKHASASSVTISSHVEAGGGFRCRVEDNGEGVPAGAVSAKDRYGVRMMRSRALGAGWGFVFHSPANPESCRGTVVEVVRTAVMVQS